MKVDKVDILYILLIPAILVFLIGFYLFIGVFVVSMFLIGGLITLYEFFAKIDFGFDKDYGMDYTKRK